MKKFNWMVALEWIGLGLSAAGTILFGWAGTRNAVRDEIDAIKEAGKNATENNEES